MDEVCFEQRGAALWLTINREDRRNALNGAVLSGLKRGLEEASGDPAVRAIVITGVGDRAFCAGGDLKPDANDDPFRTDPSQLDHPVAQVMAAISNSSVPVVARVNGHALAGGFGLVCACDFAVVVDHAKLGVPEARVGIFPMMILPSMLRVLSRRKLLELCVTGEPMTAAEALVHGVANHVVPAAELDSRVESVIASIVKSSPTAIRLGRRAIAMMDSLSLAQSLEYAQRVLPQMARTEDAREGFRAFNEKRSPVWTGR